MLLPRKELPMTTADRRDPVRGRTIRWTWTDGPTQGTTHEHVFAEDGTVTWRGLEGPGACPPTTEKEYAAVAISDDVQLVSYLAASGYTLTVALNFRDRRMAGFASNSKEW